MKRNVMIALIVSVVIIGVGWFLLSPKASTDLPVYAGAKFDEKKTQDAAKKLELCFIEGCKVGIYTTPDDPGKVIRFYEAEMKKGGWEIYNKMDPFFFGGSYLGGNYNYFFKKGDQGAAIITGKSITGGTTNISTVVGPWVGALQAQTLIIVL